MITAIEQKKENILPSNPRRIRPSAHANICCRVSSGLDESRLGGVETNGLCSRSFDLFFRLFRPQDLVQMWVGRSRGGTALLLHALQLFSAESFSKFAVSPFDVRVSFHVVVRRSLFVPLSILLPCHSVTETYETSSWIWKSENPNRQSRRITTPPITLRPIKPLPLASASFEVRRDGSDVLPAGDHGAAHFVAVSVDCRLLLAPTSS